MRETKFCRRCGRTEEFYANQSCCKECSKEKVKTHYAANPDRHRERSRKYRQDNIETVRTKQRNRHYVSSYGITAGLRDIIAEAQDWRCGLCEQPAAKLHVDHDHATGAIRGLLCSPCNTALGLMRDNAELMRRAADYVEFHAAA